MSAICRYHDKALALPSPHGAQVRSFHASDIVYSRKERLQHIEGVSSPIGHPSFEKDIARKILPAKRSNMKC